MAWDNYDCLSLEKNFTSLTVNSLKSRQEIDEIKSAIDSESVDFRNVRKKVIVES